MKLTPRQNVDETAGPFSELSAVECDQTSISQAGCWGKPARPIECKKLLLGGELLKQADMSTISSTPKTTLVLDTQTDHPNVLQNAAAFLWFIEILILYTRFFDLAAAGLRIPAVVFIMLLITFAGSGEAFGGIFSPVGRVVLLLVGWITLTLPFSIWRSGSIPHYKALLSSLVFFLVASGLGYILRNVKLTMYALALSGLIAALKSFVWGDSFYGRQILVRGSYHDPNDYALILLMCVPFWWLLSASAKSKVAKMAAFACTIPVFYVFSRTGSRGAMIGLIVMLLIVFFKASLPKKGLMIAVTMIALVGILAVMPDYIRARYLTYFDLKSSGVETSRSSGTSAEVDQLKADVDSAEGRKRLLLKSIELTLRYPLFGVGPGNFPVAVFEDAKRNGDHYGWLVTHNTYTQYSSETGFPGFFLFLAMVYMSFRNIAKVLKLTKAEGQAPEPEIYKAATYLRLSMAAVFTTIFFLSFGYYPLVYILAGLTVGLARAAQRHERNQKLAIEEGDAPIPAEPFKPALFNFRLRAARGSEKEQTPGQKRDEKPRPARFNRYR